MIWPFAFDWLLKTRSIDLKAFFVCIKIKSLRFIVKVLQVKVSQKCPLQGQLTKDKTRKRAHEFLVHHWTKFRVQKVIQFSILFLCLASLKWEKLCILLYTLCTYNTNYNLYPCNCRILSIHICFPAFIFVRFNRYFFKAVFKNRLRATDLYTTGYGYQKRCTAGRNSSREFWNNADKPL